MNLHHRFALPFLLLMAALLTFGVAGQNDIGEWTAITLDEIIDNPDNFYGQQVEVNGHLVEGVNENTFFLQDDDSIDPDQIMVLMTEDTALSIAQLAEEDVQVIVTGVVYPFDYANLQDETGNVLDPNIFGDYEDDPVIVATEVNTLSMPEPLTSTMMSENPLASTVDEVTDDPVVFYSQVISIEEEVHNAITANAFTLQDNDFFQPEELLVLYDTSKMMNGINIGLLADQHVEVRVSGTLREYIQADFDSDLDFDLSDERFADYENQPVLVADSVTVVGEYDPNVSVDLGNIQSSPAVYYDQYVTAEADLVEALNANAFVLENDGDRLPVIYHTDQISDMNIVQIVEDDVSVRVVGIVRPFNREQFIEEMPDMDFDVDIFDDYEGTAVLVADNVTLLEQTDIDETTDIAEITGQSELYDMLEVTVEAQLVEAISNEAFYLQRQEFLDDNTIMVLFDPDEFEGLDIVLLASEDVNVRVEGVVRIFDPNQLEAEDDFDLSNPVFDDEAGNAVIVATNIIVLDDNE